MHTKRSYRQNCALAITLDLVGDRWTLLIIRELLIAPRQFTAMLRNLPGIGTNLLSERLARLTQDGLVLRESGSGHPIYRLSSRGRALEPAVHALIQWGMGLSERRQADHFHAPEWDLLPLRSVFDPAIGRAWRGSYRLCLDKSAMDLVYADGRLEQTEPDAPPVAEIAMSMETALDLFGRTDAWRQALAEGDIQTTGKAADVALFFEAFAQPADDEAA